MIGDVVEIVLVDLRNHELLITDIMIGFIACHQTYTNISINVYILHLSELNIY